MMTTRIQIPMKPAAAPALSTSPVPSGVLRRKCACGGAGGTGGECSECKKKKLQRKAAGGAPGVAPPIVHQVLNSPGHPLDASSRSYFEPRFGHDFSKVRIHTGGRADESARSVNALAYTVGPRIVFGAGQYKPGAPSGQRLLAHELTHVVQQQGQPVGGGPLRVGPVGDAHEREAESTAQATMNEGTPAAVGQASAMVQRQAATPSGGSSGTSAPGGGATAVPKPETCAAPKDLACSPTKDAAKGVTDTLTFLVDSSDLGKAKASSTAWPTAKAEIAAAAESWRKAGATGNIRVDGYASAEYECVYNWHLSCRRAQAVKEELKKQGVPESNISLYAHGESDEAGAALAPNRRATIVLPSAPPPPPKPVPTPVEPQKPEPVNKCGPDITSSLSATLSKVETYFNGLSGWEKRRSCAALTGDAPLIGVNPIMAWDVVELFLPNTYWLDSYFRTDGCGSPRDPGCDGDPTRNLCETSGTCGNTVLVGGKCMLAGTANYAVYGKMFSMCADEFWYMWGFQMRNLIRLYKLIGRDDSGPPLAMANAAFHGSFPSISSDAENRGHCTGRCGSSARVPFDFVWEPYKSR